MNKVIVLGAGMVGSAMAIDMAKKHKVLLTDINQDVLATNQKKCPDLDVMVLDATDSVFFKYLYNVVSRN